MTLSPSMSSSSNNHILMDCENTKNCKMARNFRQRMLKYGSVMCWTNTGFSGGGASTVIPIGQYSWWKTNYFELNGVCQACQFCYFEIIEPSQIWLTGSDSPLLRVDAVFIGLIAGLCCLGVVISSWRLTRDCVCASNSDSRTSKSLKSSLLKRQ